MAAEAHDATKRTKSTRWRGAFILLPSDVVPPVEGTVLDPPPAVSYALAYNTVK